MHAPQISVIIPVFNKWALTRNCLAALREHSPAGIEVIVVDNASTDETAGALEPLGRELFGDGFLAIRNRENINFGPACNLGAKAATAPLVFFLNNDTIPTPGWLAPLLAGLDKPGTGAVGPLLLYENRTVQHLGIAFSTTGISHLYAGFPESHPAVGRKRKLQAITGAAMLLSKELFFATGAFHEGYRNGFEDVDLCVQLRNAGHSLQCVRDSIIFHLEGQSEGRGTDERHNAALLSERCKEFFHPDLHHHGMRDGFTPVINDRLGVSLLVSDKQDRELMDSVEGKGAEFLFQLAEANPYWVRGYEILGDLLAENGSDSEASYMFSRIIKFFPNLAYARRTYELAVRSGDAEAVEHARACLEPLRFLLSDKAKYKAATRRFIATAEEYGDTGLAELYAQKLAGLPREFNEG